MTTQEYIEGQTAYLERLKRLRDREKQNLSVVDYELFSRRFDRLISKIENEIQHAHAVQHALCNVHVEGFIFTNVNTLSFEHLNSGTYASVCEYQNTMKPTVFGSGSVFQCSESYPGWMFFNSTVVHNEKQAIQHQAFAPNAMQA